MILKAILENELINWVEVKKWDTYECDDNMWSYLLRAYGNRREEIKDDEIVDDVDDVADDEIVEEKKERKSKKSK